MILKYLSTHELNYSKSWTDGWNKIKDLSNFERYMTFFWFLGPFIYLIERDPADIWLTLISLIFLIRCYKLNHWNWSKQLWFRLALALWAFSLFSAILSPDPIFSFQQGFVWIRFPLYVAAAQVWLAKDRDIRIIMFLSIVIAMLLMCAILISECIIEPKTRLTWPYGDVVPGGYIVKFSLPVFCVLVAIAVAKKNKSGFYSGIIALVSIFVSFLTGERTNFLIRACSGMLGGLVWKPRFNLYIFLVLIELLAVFFIALKKPDLLVRFSSEFVSRIPIFNMSDNNGYWGTWRGGLQQGLITPLKGIGPSGTRNTCIALDTNLPDWLPGKNNCANHPHNFYIQLFAETGIIGLLLGSGMIICIILDCLKARAQNSNCPMSATAFVVPLALFFPFQQFGSFFGQWGNLFLWFAIGFSMSQYQGWNKSKFIK